MKKLEKVFAAGLIVFSLFSISSCKKKDKKENQTSIEKEDYSEEDGTVVKHKIEKKYVYDGDGELLDYDEFKNRQLLPIGCKVLIKEDNVVYQTPAEDNLVAENFYKDEYVTVTQIGYANSSHTKDSNSNQSNWIKIVSKDGEEGWIRSCNLKMISENPNSVSIKILWTKDDFEKSSLSPDGKYVCLKKEGAHNGWVGTLAVYETETGECVLKYDAASEYDKNSSDETVFSKDGKSVFFEEDLVLSEINIETKEIKTYGTPSYEYGQVGRMLLNDEGTKIYYFLSSSNDKLLSAVCDLKTSTWTRITSLEEDTKVRKEFEGFDFFEVEYDLFDYQPWLSSLTFIKNKNVLLYSPWRTDDENDGIYFHDMKTGKLIKAENPCIACDDNKKILIDNFSVSENGSKIAILGYNSGDNIFQRTFYICDLDLSKLEVTDSEVVETEEQKSVKEDKNYLCSNGFHLVDQEGNYLAYVRFKNDNTFSAIDDPNGDPCYGTYSLTAKNGKTLVSFSNFKSAYGSDSTVNFYRRYMHDGYVDQNAYDFETVGGITYTDDCDRFITCDKEVEAYKEYYYKGWNVIKYPFREGRSVRLRTLENLKMRSGPSLDSDPVYFTFYDYDSENGTRSDERCTVLRGEDFRIMASSVNKETIDGIEAYWYLIRVWDSKYADYDSKFIDVWIFGGYVDTYYED